MRLRQTTMRDSVPSEWLVATQHGYKTNPASSQGPKTSSRSYDESTKDLCMTKQASFVGEPGFEDCGTGKKKFLAV